MKKIRLAFSMDTHVSVDGRGVFEYINGNETVCWSGGYGATILNARIVNGWTDEADDALAEAAMGRDRDEFVRLLDESFCGTPCRPIVGYLEPLNW